jgi:hypothetical protein
LEKLLQLRSVGINVPAMQKGDHYTIDQVHEAYHKLDPKLPAKLERYENGEIGDPMSFAAQNVINAIEKIRSELNLEPLVIRSSHGSLRVLKDSEAVTYLNNQANAAIKKHKAKTEQQFTHINAENLDEKQSKQLEANRRRHAFIAASAQGARTQALKLQRKGVQLPPMD